MKKFTFVGPQTRGPMFHVHMAGCRDIPKRFDGYNVEAENVDAAIAEEIAEYVSQEQTGWTPEQFKVFPCAK